MSPLLRFAARAEALLRHPIGLTLLALLALVQVWNASDGDMRDFTCFRLAAIQLLERSDTYLAVGEAPGVAMRYVYSPAATFFFVPFTWVPHRAACIAWGILQLFCSILVLRRSLAVAFPEGALPDGASPARDLPEGTVFLLLLVGARFIDTNLGHGQINPLVLALVLAALHDADSNREQRGGLFLALAATFKPFVALLAIPALLRGRRRFAVCAALNYAALALLPVLHWRGEYPALLASFWEQLQGHGSSLEIGNKINQSIQGTLARLFRPTEWGPLLLEAPRSIVLVLAVVVHGTFAIPILRAARRGDRGAGVPTPETSPGTRTARELLYLTVVNPFSWKHYFLGILPAVALTIRALHRPRARTATWIYLAVVLMTLLPGDDLLGPGSGLWLLRASLHFWSVVLLFWALPRLRPIEACGNPRPLG